MSPTDSEYSSSFVADNEIFRFLIRFFISMLKKIFQIWRDSFLRIFARPYGRRLKRDADLRSRRARVGFASVNRAVCLYGQRVRTQKDERTVVRRPAEIKWQRKCARHYTELESLGRGCPKFLTWLARKPTTAQLSTGRSKTCWLVFIVSSSRATVIPVSS